MRPLALAAAAVLAACAAPPQAQSSPPTDALYAPDATYAASAPETATVVSLGRIGGDREVPVAVRGPVGAVGPRPVVVWSHGGADGKTNPLRSGPEWAEALAEAGYVVVSVAHPPRGRRMKAALCTHVGYTRERDCDAAFRTVRWDRPLDLAAVLDWVEAGAAGTTWGAEMDLDRVAVAGHSAGSSGAAALAGMVRAEGAVGPVDRTDPRPEAFLMLALQGPSGANSAGGIEPDAWAAIDRPAFGATGLGDETEGDTPANRVLAFDAGGGVASAGSRLLWVEDAAAAHTLFNLEDAACRRRGASADDCAALLDVVRTSAIAFLDAHLRSLDAAQIWLDDADLEAATGGSAWWHTVVE